MENVQRVLGKLALPLAIFCCLVVSGSIAFNYIYMNKVGNDFSVYLRTAGAPLEDAYGFPGKFPFPYAPTMLLWLKSAVEPLLATPGFLLFTVFAGGGVLAYYFSLKRYVPIGAILLCLISPAIIRGVLTGQVSILLSAFAIWGLAQKDRVLTGVAFGIIATIKPQLVIMAPLFFFIEKDWRALAWAAGSFCSFLAVTLLAFGTQPWIDWLDSMPKFQRAVTAISAGGIGTSPALMAQHFGLSPIPFIGLGIVLGALLTVFAERGDAVRNAAIIVLSSLLAAPYSLTYDLAAVVPILAMMTMKKHFCRFGDWNAVPDNSLGNRVLGRAALAGKRRHRGNKRHFPSLI